MSEHGLEAAAASVMPQNEECGLEELLSWAANLGIADCPCGKNQDDGSCLGYSLCVSSFEEAGGRGLAATRNLSKGELILRVPKGALMSLDSLAKDNVPLFQSRKRYPQLQSKEVLVIYLLAEVAKGKNSFWHPYLLRLPRVYFLLATFSDFEAEALQIEDAVLVAQSIRKSVYYDWEKSQELMREVGLKRPYTSFRSWLWAFATVSSRTLHVPWDSAGCLCPIGDLFNYAAPGADKNIDNHANSDLEPCSWLTSTGITNKSYLHESLPHKECSSSQHSNEDCSDRASNILEGRLIDAGYEAEVDSYCFYARKQYMKGEQVLLCYGEYTNLELLEHYGFVLQENPNEKVLIELDDDFLSIATRYWEKSHLYLHWNGKPSFSLLAALRLYKAPPHLRKALGHRVFSGFPLSVEHDKVALSWLAQKCVYMMSRLPTTISEDEFLVEVIDDCLGVGGKDFLSRTFQEIQRNDHADRSIMLKQFTRWPSLSLESQNRISNQLRNFFELNISQRHNFTNLPEEFLGFLLNKWKLAINWRLGYKRVLEQCVIFCDNEIKSLSGR